MNNDFLLKDGNEVVLPSFVDEDFKPHWKDSTFTNDQHHAHLESTSSSSLKVVIDSPYTYLSGLMDRQNGIEKKPSKSMNFGTIAHLMILEPAEFKRRFIMAPKFDRRTNVEKAAEQAFLSDLPPDAVIMNEEEYDDFMGVINAIMQHEKARDIFTEGVTEVSGFYRDPVTGLLIRIRPDFISTRNDLSMFIDLKTARDSSYKGFQRQIGELRYDMQLALYREGIKQITGSYPEICGWTVVENKRPYEVSIFTADNAMIEIGERWCRYALDRLAKCIRDKKFPQRQTMVEDMAPSKYMMDQEIPTIGATNG